jgi:hypothetical protein
MTSGTDALVTLFNVLTPDEQEEAFARIADVRLNRLAGDESDAARFLRSLRRVVEELGEFPSVGDYKRISEELIAAGEDIETFARLYSYYGTWPRAREALTSADTTTPKRIEARFRSRKIGKVWRFTEDVLRDTLRRCSEHYGGRAMTVAEFEHWRDRELELARAHGNEDLHLPSASPYRRHWKTWEAALLHFGFTPEEAAQRYQPPYDPAKPQTEPYLPEGLSVAELRSSADGLPLTAEEAEALLAAWQRLPRRTRYIFTVRLGLGVPAQTLREACAPLSIRLDRVSQIQIEALDVLARAVAGAEASPERVGEMRERVVAALSLLGGGQVA